MRVVKDWTTLEGRYVEVHVLGTLTDQGQVDAVMPDGTLLWLKNDGRSPRRITEKLPNLIIKSNNKA